MSGWWLVTYVGLSVIVICLVAVDVGVLRQVGMLRLLLREESHSAGAPPPRPDEDGPPLGSPLPEAVWSRIGGSSVARDAPGRGETNTLLVFGSPLCPGCQHMVRPLNAVLGERNGDLSAVVIMRGDEHACKAFGSVFPVDAPMVCDIDSKITMGFRVHNAPMGLLYGPDHKLARKGPVGNYEALLALLGDGCGSAVAPEHVYSPLTASTATETDDQGK